MRRIFVAAVVGFLVVFAVVILTPSQNIHAQAPTSARDLVGGPTGLVKTVSDSRSVDGLMVQLIAQTTSIRTTVYTDESGRFEFPKLETGDYTLRIPRPLEFRPYVKEGVRINGATQLDDILVERAAQAQGDFLVPTPELLPQLTPAEWMANMPGTAQEKEAFLVTCSSGCHSLDYPFRVKYDEASWRKLLHRMMGYQFRIMIPPSRDRGAGGNAELITNWLTRIRSLDSVIPPIKPFPRPHGPATRAVVTEYELPWALVNVHDVAGDADANIWFTINRSPFLGKLDPKTGKVITYRTPKPPPMDIKSSRAYIITDPPGIHPGLHWVEVDQKTGVVWFSDTWSETLGRLDPRTGDMRLVNTGLHGNVALAPDGASIWRTDEKKIKKYDTATVMNTGKPVKEYALKTTNSTYGNFLSWDGRYFGGGGNNMVWLDTQTGEIRERRLVVGGKGRGAFDGDGNMWIGGERLAKYDPKADLLVEYPLPTPHTNLYSARADKNGQIWAGEMQGGRVARFNPKTHQWIEYVLPSPWSFDFNSWIDNSTSPPTFWYGDQYGYIVRIQPRE